MKNLKIIVASIVLIISANLTAQEHEVLITDRPDQTESPQVVGKGVFQIETGAGYEKTDDKTVKSTTYNTTLIRYGLSDNLELRLGGDLVGIKKNGVKVGSTGYSPLLFGAKIAISKEKGWMPEIGLLGHLSLPFTASSEFKPEYTGVDFRFSFAHTLSERSSLSYNLGAAIADDSPELNYLYTLVYGYGLTERLGFYIELYGDFPEDTKDVHRWDAGFTYLVSNDLQLDVLAGTQVHKSANQDFMFGFGVSYRIPAKK